MNNTNAAFDQADVNRDGSLSQNEFRNFVARNSVLGGDLNGFGGGNSGYGSSAFRSSTYEASSAGGLGGNLSYDTSGLATGAGGYGSSSYESSSYRASVGNAGGDLGNLNVAGTAGLSAEDAASASFQSSSIQQYATDEQGNFKDPNPQVVRRPAQSGPLTYSQNIRVRFLQPPAAPPPGVSCFCLCLNFIFTSILLAINYQRSTTTSTTTASTTSRSSTSTSCASTTTAYFTRTTTTETGYCSISNW